MKNNIKNNEGIKDVVNFVKEYNLNVVMFSYLKTDNNIQGYVAINKERRDIGVYYHLPYSTKKFLVIYLLSSYILNGNDELFADIVYNESIYDKEVYDFTLDLLMPDKHFKEILDTSNGDVLHLTDIYNLSKVMIEEKIKKLKK